MRKLNVLLLTWLGNPKRRRKAVEELEFRLPLFAPDHNYIIHDFDYPITEELKKVDFDLIYIGPTFLCLRNKINFREILREKYGFIKDSAAVKIAFPQDDYYCSATLDEWLCYWEVDSLFTVLPSHSERFYPNYSRLNKPIFPAFTGYISEECLGKWEHTKARGERTTDISYRAFKAWPNVNRLAHVKAEFAHRFLDSYSCLKNNKKGLNIDVSTDATDMIAGEAWHEFVENSKCCLTTKSGSDHQDPFGFYKAKAMEYVQEFPDPDFYEVRNYVNIADMDYGDFTAISPRNIEAGLAHTIQIAVPGEYNGIFESGVHYIPIAEDCSDLDLVFEMISDDDLTMRITKDCKEALMSVDDLRFTHHVQHVIDLTKEILASKKKLLGSKQEQFLSAKHRYWEYLLSHNFKSSLLYPHLYL